MCPTNRQPPTSTVETHTVEWSVMSYSRVTQLGPEIIHYQRILCHVLVYMYLKR